MKRISILTLLIACFQFGSISAQTNSNTPDFLQYENSKWVDSIMKTLSQEERIAQLIMVAAYSNKGEEHKQEILKLIKEQKIGGLIFFQGGPVRQSRLINEYQNASKVKLLMAIDAEWGVGMRLDSTITYPFQMSMGAVQKDSLIYETGNKIGQQLKRLGIHLNFAPVVDVNNNPENPVINFRSFGEDKRNVARKGIAYMKGLQDAGILATAKHFPGHGDTATDSHLALPQINNPRSRLDTLELYPFREIIKAGIGGVMVAHLDIPALDSTGVPSTLSKPIITGLLKEELGFTGLIVTDAMNMKGVTKDNSPGVVDKDAILAGNDLLEFTEDVPKAIAEVKKAIENGLITQQEIDSRCRKILALKQWSGLDHFKPVDLVNLTEDLNKPDDVFLAREISAASLTVLKNDHNILPLQRLDTLNILQLDFGKSLPNKFTETLQLYTKIDHFSIPLDSTDTEIEKIRRKLSEYNLIIAAVYDESRFPRNSSKLTSRQKKFLSEISNLKNSVIVLFKNPYVLSDLDNVENAPALILTYQDNSNSEELAAQLIFGGIGAHGKLPVSIGKKFKAGYGLDLPGGIRFEYTAPESVGINSRLLEKRIDSLMNEALRAKAIPGGQILIAKDQKVIFYKSYGTHTYHDTIEVKKDDLYNLASITKVSSVVPALMKLNEEGKFDLNKGLQDYLPSFRNSNKGDISMRDILAHQAGFKSWIPFWKNTLRKNGSYKWNTFKKDSSSRFPVKVAENMWLHKNFKKKIWKEIEKSPVSDKKEYVYSGLAFYLFPEIIHKLTGENFTEYLDQEFYGPLGATTLIYNPLKKFDACRIVPTENDFAFRHIEIHGTVHDEGAILMNGISGNAGLFANANDLAKLMQMYLNYGEYGGRRYISEEIMKEWTSYQFKENDNRRGLGFDKPSLGERTENGNTAIGASDLSFGHTGFTGTMSWMDPENKLLYIFLSNRVSPTRENTLLYSLNTRTNIQEVIYKLLEEGAKNKKGR